MRDATHTRGRALTMVELLVCLGVLGIALGSVLSVFVAGTHFAAKANRTMDAGRVARAVFDLFQRGWEEPPAGSGAWHGRNADGAVVEEAIESEQMPSICNVSVAWAPAYVVDSPLALVWRSKILTPNPYTFELDGIYNVEVTVSVDGNDNGSFDAADEEIGRWYGVVADR